MELFNWDLPDRVKGRRMALGFLDVISAFIIIGFLMLYLLMAVMPTDDSDKGRFDRSGVKIVTDAKTNKQYLVTPSGGIIERSE